MPWMAAMLGWVEAGEDLRLPREPGEPVWVAGEGVGEDLQGDLAVELRVGGLPDLAHAALAEQGGDVVVAEARAGSEWHDLMRTIGSFYAEPVNASTIQHRPESAARRFQFRRWRWWRRWSWFWWWCYVEPSVTEEGGDVVVPDAGAGTQGHGGLETGVILCPTGYRLHLQAQNCPEEAHVRGQPGSRGLTSSANLERGSG